MTVRNPDVGVRSGDRVEEMILLHLDTGG
jgi:hypothetical protein